MFEINRQDSKKLRKEIPNVKIFTTKRKYYIEDGVLFEHDIQSNVDNLSKLISMYELIDQSEKSKSVLQNLKYNLNKQMKILKGIQK